MGKGEVCPFLGKNGKVKERIAYSAIAERVIRSY